MILLEVIQNDLSLTWVISTCASVVVFVVGAMWKFALRDKAQSAQIKVLLNESASNRADDKENYQALYNKIKAVEEKSDKKDKDQEEKITQIRVSISKLEK